MLRIGTQKIAALYAGAAEIKKALVGNSVVFEANPGGLPAGYSACLLSKSTRPIDLSLYRKHSSS